MDIISLIYVLVLADSTCTWYVVRAIESNRITNDQYRTCELQYYKEYTTACVYEFYTQTLTATSKEGWTAIIL